MATAIPQNANVYTELSSLQALKGKVKSGDNKAIENVAKQFEAIFLQMMLSGMRKTIQVNEEYSNDKSTYYDLFDKQVAMNMSESGGIGLARVLMQQGGIEGQRSVGVAQSTSVVNKATEIFNHISKEQSEIKINAGNKHIQSAEKTSSDSFTFDSPMQFLQTIWDVAKDVIKDSGLSPKAVLAQAALETGWGKHIIKSVAGESSFNLFGIKSDSQWSGESALANTLEYQDGVMVKSREGFRSYASIKESVQDYVGFLKTNQRYADALNKARDPDAYVVELQKAGYATDPNYASKIQNIMRRPEFAQLLDESGINGI